MSGFGAIAAAVVAVLVIGGWAVAFAILGKLAVNIYQSGGPTKPAPDNGQRVCSACGDLYHKSWGRICPNCSGAD